MGFRVIDESTYQAQTFGRDAPDFWLHDMALERADGGKVDLGDIEAHLETCFLMVMRGLAENDGFNALVLAAGLPWRDIALLRTFARYLRQIRVPYSQDYLWTTLTRHGAIAAKIATLFHVRFDPRLGPATGERAVGEAALVAEIDADLAKVDSLDEDRIIRHFVNIVQAAMRTNFYQLGDGGRPQRRDRHQARQPQGRRHAAAAAAVRDLRLLAAARGGASALRQGGARRHPLVRPAAGFPHRGARASSRRSRSRTPCIVPVGAKGGFVPKRMPAGPRDAVQAEGVATYQHLHVAHARPHRQYRPRRRDRAARRHGAPRRRRSLSGGRRRQGHRDLLRHRQRHRAASTASGSTTPSRRAARPATTTRAWASRRAAPGNRSSAISARWTSTSAGRRSPRSASATCRATCSATACCASAPPSSSPRSTTATSSSIRRPIRNKTFAERKRLFDLPRSSWQDFDKSLISAGGGVFPRSLKEIDLSPQAQAALGLAQAKATPQEVMRAILKAPVDLLFFGGIGTYVRAAAESDDAVGDRANDPIRITGADLRCKVVGEGANLGMTQRGRIEAAHARHPPQHRRDRQFGRRQHLRRRGQPQDRAQPADARRPDHPRRPQRAARRA